MLVRFAHTYLIAVATFALLSMVGYPAYAQIDFPRYIPYMPLKYSDTVFASNAKTTIYSKPDAQSQPLVECIAGDTLIIVDSLEYNSDAPLPKFYHVRHNKLDGYIATTDIAIYKFYVINETSNSTILIGVTDNKTDDSLLFREYFENILITSFAYPYYNSSFSMVMHGNRGLSNLSKIFEVMHFAEACGEDGGATYIGWSHADFYEIIHASSIGDGGIYSQSTTILFPEDDGGMEGKIIYRREINEITNEELGWEFNSIETRIYDWTGTGLEPPFVENLNEDVDEE